MTNCAQADHEVDLVCRQATLLSVCQQGRRETTWPTGAFPRLRAWILNSPVGPALSVSVGMSW